MINLIILKKKTKHFFINYNLYNYFLFYNILHKLWYKINLFFLYLSNKQFKFFKKKLIIFFFKNKTNYLYILKKNFFFLLKNINIYIYLLKNINFLYNFFYKKNYIFSLKLYLKKKNIILKKKIKKVK